jgi:hypothetical protein
MCCGILPNRTLPKLFLSCRLTDMKESYLALYRSVTHLTRSYYAEIYSTAAYPTMPEGCLSCRLMDIKDISNRTLPNWTAPNSTTLNAAILCDILPNRTLPKLCLLCLLMDNEDRFGYSKPYCTAQCLNALDRASTPPDQTQMYFFHVILRTWKILFYARRDQTTPHQIKLCHTRPCPSRRHLSLLEIHLYDRLTDR